MKLKYSVLWIEDNPRSIRRDKGKIIEYITELGFECIDGVDIKVITSLSDFRKSVGYKKASDFDLLLVDLDLGRSVNKDEGDSIVREVRREKNFSEIVFYSAHYEDLSAKLNANFVEGVFTSSREELADKVIKIIDVTIKKTQDVNNLRGLIMAEVAELDRLKKVIVKKYIEKNTDHDDLKRYIKNKVFSQLKDNVDEFSYLLIDNDDYISKMNIAELVENFIFDSSKKSKTVFKVKRLESSCSSIPFVHDNYFNDVIKKRNVLAHEEEKIDGDGANYLSYPDGQRLYFNKESCISIRKDIKKYKKNLEDIISALDLQLHE